MKTLICSLALAFLTATPVFGWGDQGHKAIWTVVQKHLTPQAKARVDEILAGQKLAHTATWLDKARDAAKTPPSGLFKDDPITAAFNTAFPGNDKWHYSDLPTGATSYADSSGFTGDSDAVQRINFAIKVLEGHDATLSKMLALRVLVHLVGDIHQPLHCISGFYDTTNLAHPILKNGASAAAFMDHSDRGGNQLYYGPGKFDELHAFFDGKLVADLVDGSASYVALAEHLDDMLATENAHTSGDIHGWAEKWANESFKLADAAYKKLTFGQTELYDHDFGKGFIKSIQITFPDTFEDEEKEVVDHQLAKASLRLADLLNRILDPQ